MVNGNIMWIVGGYMLNNSDYNMVLAYDLVPRKWLPLNRSANDVIVRYGHLLALYKKKFTCMEEKLMQQGM